MGGRDGKNNMQEPVRKKDGLLLFVCSQFGNQLGRLLTLFGQVHTGQNEFNLGL